MGCLIKHIVALSLLMKHPFYYLNHRMNVGLQEKMFYPFKAYRGLMTASKLVAERMKFRETNGVE